MLMLILCDIDGVVADPCDFVEKYLQGPKKDWGEYYKHTLEVKPVPAMIELVNNLTEGGKHCVVFCTGRPESNRIATLTWLNRYLKAVVVGGRLLMRANGDVTLGCVLKLRWALRLKPDLILEDEPEAVRLLRDYGFMVLKVYGHRLNRSADYVPA